MKNSLYRFATLVLLGGLSCVGTGVNAYAAALPEAAASSAMFTRQGDRLTVPQASPLRARLVTALVADQALPRDIALPATVEADPSRVVNILPPVTGKVVELKVRLGDKVQRGQVLASISSPDFAQAVADAQKARDALDLAQRALSRARGVNEAGANAAKDLEAAESSVFQQTAELRRSESRLRSMGASNALTTENRSALLSVTSPIDGTVTTLSVAAGATVNDATAAIMTVADLSQVWLTVSVPENLLGTVGPGQSVRMILAAYPSQEFIGKIAFVGALLEADTRRAKARCVFANPKGMFKPNMYATAHIAVPQSSGPHVPVSALLMNNDSVTVFVEVEPWTFMRRKIQLGSEDGDQVRVRSGLKAGERVLVKGGVLLND